MEGLYEQVVKPAKSKTKVLKIIAIIAIAITIPVVLGVLAYVISAYFIYIAFFVLLFCIYGAWYFISSLNIEYEYAVLGSTLRIDKVIAKRRRKLIVKTDIKQFDDFFRYDDKEMSNRRFGKVYEAPRQRYSDENFVATFHNEAKGKCAIIFTPNEKILNAMKPHFNREIARKLYREKIV